MPRSVGKMTMEELLASLYREQRLPMLDTANGEFNIKLFAQANNLGYAAARHQLDRMVERGLVIRVGRRIFPASGRPGEGLRMAGGDTDVPLPDGPTE